MARGRPDYWYSMLPGKAVFAPNQSQWAQYGTASMAYEAIATPIDYTVPADTILVICSGYVSINNPRDFYCYISIDTVVKMRLYLSSYELLPFNPTGIFQLNAGENVTLKITGNNERTINTYAGLIGYEETKTQ